MKRRSIFIYTIFLVVLITTACRKKLDEQPRSILTPEFFQTVQGFQQGLMLLMQAPASFGETRIILQLL